MLVYHGTSKTNSKLIKTFGMNLNTDSMNIDNQGYSTFINAFFCTPNTDIAHIYECDNSENGAVIIEIELNNNSKIFDLTNTENQNIIKEFLNNNKDKNINDFLTQNNFDGCKQYHKNDFGKKRLEYAIININILSIVNIPTKATKFMSLYVEATMEDVNPYDYV